jgi:nucleotide-binding universal stress UspA family protein
MNRSLWHPFADRRVIVTMRRLQSILLASDFGQASQEAARVAARIGSALGSRVHLLHVLELPPGWPIAPCQERDQAAGPIRDLAKQLTAQNVEVAGWFVRIGSRASTIVRKAAEIDADLILLGAGELSAVDRFQVGPVAETVIEQAPQPVLAVRPGEPGTCFRTILCPVDLSEVSARGLRNAIRLTRAFEGRLVVLTVVPVVSWLTAATQTGQLTGARVEYENRWCAGFDKFLEGIDFEGVHWVADVRQGEPHAEIVAAVREHGADLLVMGATGRTGLVRVVLGSVTRRVLRQLSCSLLTVKDEDLLEEQLEGDRADVGRLMAEGERLLAGGSCEAALTKFGRVLVRNPYHVPALEGRALAHAKLGQMDEAADYRRRAAALQDEGKL